jgi:hypothetical protein
MMGMSRIPHPAHLGLQIPPVKFTHPCEAVALAGTGSSIPQSQIGGVLRPPQTVCLGVVPRQNSHPSVFFFFWIFFLF